MHRSQSRLVSGLHAGRQVKLVGDCCDRLARKIDPEGLYRNETAFLNYP